MTDDLRLRAEAAYQQWKRERPLGIAIDTETTGLGYHDEAFCVTVAWYTEGELRSHYLETALPDVLELARGMILGTEGWVFHNAKFDLQKLVLADIIPADSFDYERVHDTELLAWLHDENSVHGLKPLAEEVLGLTTDEEAVIGAWFKEHKIKKDDRNYRDLPPEILVPYAIKDAEFTIQLFRALYPEVMRYPELGALYDLERKLTVALVRMESRGMMTDIEYLQLKAREYAKQALAEEVRIRELTGSEDFNPNSWQQILVAMEARGHKLDNTEADTLAALGDELADAIVNVRALRKIHGTYLLGLLAEGKDGLVHPNFRQNVSTGRMASGAAQE